MKKIKVIILARDGESTNLIFNGIRNFFSIEQVVLETPVSKLELLKRRAINLGFIKVFGQVIFMLYNNLFLKNQSKGRVSEIKLNENLIDEAINEKYITKVESINSEETIKILRKHQPHVIVVNGTRIIEKAVLDAIDAPFINTHVGITPKYRGVHGGYWALTENDIEHCGVTVHLIDSGIDTGGVLYQKAIQVTSKDNFSTYPVLQIAAAIPIIKTAIQEVANKSYKIQIIDLPSKLWSHPTIIEYLKYRILHGVK